MNSSRCRYCNEIIYWFHIQEKSKPFDDSMGSQIHRCMESNKNKINVTGYSELQVLKRIFYLLEKISARLDSMQDKQ